MAKRKVTIEFTPDPDNPEHQLLRKYLIDLESGISGAIMEAVRDKFLLTAMILANSDRFKTKIVGIESNARLKAQIEINHGMLAACNLLDSNPVQLESIPEGIPESININFANSDENDDTWDEERIISLDNVEFAQDKK
ncbi:hypothetical protein [Chamaesiphon sp.]|uniref:hypothetical protein n=1 Tax=Chamaesiphon sp. TaxID=2814140 RepID=UPI003593DAFB